MTVIYSTSEQDLSDAARRIREGALIAFPTETVYGLGANACDGEALARLYAAKGRPRFNPLILHAASTDALEPYVHFSDQAIALAKRFWPGPLTIVLPQQAETPVSKLASAGLPTAAVRVPSSETARELLFHAKTPVAAPSANVSGGLSPTKPSHVLAGLNGKIDGLIEGDDCRVGVESTIIDLSSETPVLLRAGGLPKEDIEKALGQPLTHAHDSFEDDKARPSPGLLNSHYAPKATLRLNATSPQNGETLLGFGTVTGASMNLSASSDLVEAAANLFAMLHEMDALGVDAIAVSPIPTDGLGAAINDRLNRASAPRSSE